MRGQVYRGNKDFVRRHLYLHKKNSKELNIEAARQNTDPSQILNMALALYFKEKQEGKNE